MTSVSVDAGAHILLPERVPDTCLRRRGRKQPARMATFRRRSTASRREDRLAFPLVTRVLASFLLLMSVAGCDPVASVPASDAASPSAKPSSENADATPAPSSSPAPLTADGDSTRVRQRSMKRSGGVYDLTFDNLEFAMQPEEDFRRDMLTSQIEALDGKPVIIRGFIFDGSIFSRRGIKQFVLVRDNQSCCFGPGAKLYHNIMVEMQPGKSTDFTIRPVQVEGTFSIRPWVNPGDGKTYSVFHLLANSVN